MSIRRLLPVLASAALLVAAPGVEAATASAAPTTAVPVARAADAAARTPVVAAARSAQARPRLRVTVRDRNRQLVPGHWATIKVKVRNASRATARSAHVRVAKRSGLTFRKRVVRVGALRPGKSRTVLVRVRLNVTAPRTVALSAKARGMRTGTTKVRIAPRATTWKGALQGGEPISFTVSADGRTLRSFTVPRAPGETADYWSSEPMPTTLTDIVIPAVAIGADGTVNAEIGLPDDRPDWTQWAELRATVRAGRVTAATFAWRSEYADPIHFAWSRTSPYRIAWTAARQ